MKKSKFLKMVAALAVGVVAVAGAFSLAACGGEPEGEGSGGNGGGSGEPTAHTYSFSYTKLTEAMGIEDASSATRDSEVVTASYLTGDNAFLSLGDGTVKWRSTSKASAGVIEITNNGLTVTFQGTGTLTVGFGSTGSSNVSGFALVQADGTWLEGTTTATKLTEDQTIADGYVNKAGLYTVSGTSATTITYTIETAGTYTLYSRYCYMGTSSSATEPGSRGGRILSLTMTDTY